MKIGVLFGGRSYEHEISIITASEVMAILRPEAEVYPLYAENGEFFLLRGNPSIDEFAQGKLKRKKVVFGRKNGQGAIFAGGRAILLDCVVMCCHGGEGENGNFSALMEVFDLAYTAPAPYASAVTMDKRLTKIICNQYGIKTPRGVWGHRGEDLPEKTKSLAYPLIVKPARLGSSIGIAVAHDDSELIKSIGEAFSFDADVIVEEMVKDAVELNCAAFQEGERVVVGGVENPKSWHEFLTFEEKYRGGKYKSGAGIVKGEIADRVRELTESVYRTFELFGIARLDFLYSEDRDELYLNEINAQPGSLAYYLFEEVGVSFSSLMHRVIQEGLRREREKDIISFNSGVLQNLSVLTHK